MYYNISHFFLKAGMLSVIFALLITYLITTIFGYVVHRSLHREWTGRFNRAHMTHHMKLYPPSDFYSEKYRDPGADNTVKIFAMAAVPLVVLPILLGILGILPLGITLLVIIEMLVVGWLHDYLHDAFHITNHPLRKFSLFQSWTYLHYLHHVDMNTNYGIFSFLIDKIVGTFKNKE